MSAPRSKILGLMGLGLVLATGVFVTWFQLAGTAGRMAEAKLPYIPFATDKTLGINADLALLDAVEREQSLAEMEAAGFRWLRLRFAWDHIEPSPGVYDWQIWDEIVADASRHNLTIVALLDGSPDWARLGEGATEPDAGNPLAPPLNPRDFGDFAQVFALRFGDRIDYYQVWDEPNIAPHWGAREVDPEAYGRLLREGAIRIRAADPGAVILAAALAPNVELGGANMSELLFLEGLYRWGGQDWFDVVAAQPYDLGEPFYAPADPGVLNWHRVALLRAVMERYGDEATAIWGASFGLAEAALGDVTTALHQSRQEWPWLGPMLWAAWAPSDVHGEYALLDKDREPGQSYRALRSLATEPALTWPGVYLADHPGGEYEGDWRITPAGADIGHTGDLLHISFYGTGIDLSVRRGDYRAFLFVSVDGQPANALPRDESGRAYIVLYDPLGETDTVTLAHGLPDGQHELEIIAERGWGQWAIVGWTLFRQPAGGLPWLPWGWGLAALVVLGAALYGFWPWRRGLVDLLSAGVARYRALDDRLVFALTAGAALSFYIMPGAMFSLAAFSLLALLLLLRPEMGLALVALVLPFYQRGKPLLGKAFSMVEILTILTVVGWGGSRLLVLVSEALRGREEKRVWCVPRIGISRLTNLDWGVLALVVIGAASLLWAAQGRVAMREYRTVILESAVYYALLRVMVREQREMWRVADAWVLGGGIIALVGVAQWALGQNLITADGVWRVRGFYGSPNNLALYLGKLLPLGVAISVWGWKKERRWVYGVAAVFMAFAIFLTYSRGAWLLGVPASLVLLAIVRGRRALAAVAGVLGLAVVAMVLLAGTGRLTTLLDTSAGTTFFRLQLWQSSWAMIRDHPILGVGLDNFLYHYRTYYVLPTAWEEFNLSHPHNLVFDFWLRLGLAGLLAFFWQLVGFFRRGWRVYLRLPESDARLLVLGLVAGMVNLGVHGLVDNAFFLVDLAFAFVLMLALVQVAGSKGTISEQLET